MPLIQGPILGPGRNTLQEKMGGADLAVDALLLCAVHSKDNFDASIVWGGQGATHEELNVPDLKHLYTFNALDPTMRNKWTKVELASANAIFLKLKEHLANGETVVVTCSHGQNRSAMFAHALDPTFDKPKCESLQRAAAVLGDLDALLALSPLGPDRAKRSRTKAEAEANEGEKRARVEAEDEEAAAAEEEAEKEAQEEDANPTE